MKNRIIILAALITLGILSATCSQKTCPVYSDNSTETNQDAG